MASNAPAQCFRSASGTCAVVSRRQSGFERTYAVVSRRQSGFERTCAGVSKRQWHLRSGFEVPRWLRTHLRSGFEAPKWLRAHLRSVFEAPVAPAQWFRGAKVVLNSPAQCFRSAKWPGQAKTHACAVFLKRQVARASENARLRSVSEAPAAPAQWFRGAKLASSASALFFSKRQRHLRSGFEAPKWS